MSDYNEPLIGELEDDKPFDFEPDESVVSKGFAVTYDRKFNLGNWDSLHASITIWVKSLVPEGEAFDLHHAKARVREMARENVRAQYLKQKGVNELVFLGLKPPETGEDPIFVRTVSVSLELKTNLGNYESLNPAYTDWADVRHAAGSSGELHIALTRMWLSLWANVQDEIARAQGHGQTGDFFGYPIVTVEDLTASKPPTLQPNERLLPTRVSA
jgi:hypothetical protein